MVRRRRCLLLALSLTLAGLLPKPALARHHWTEAELNARIARENNPIKRAKLVMQLGRLQLTESSEAYNKGDIEHGAKLLEMYWRNMQQAWTVLKQTNRNPVKHPDGFKDLEINLREARRILQDLAQHVSYDVRDPVLKAESETAALRSKVILALFPDANPKTGDKKK
jgi:hypothetical protein